MMMMRKGSNGGNGLIGFIMHGISCATSNWLQAGQLGFDSQQGSIFLFTTMSREALRPTQPPTPLGTRIVS
jgi:hypothetical protein